jgi:hypothetical protein
MFKTTVPPRLTSSGRLALGLLALGLALGGTLTSCGSSGGGGNVVYSISSLSGTVRGEGTGLPGVTVSVGTTSAVSDAAGNFILPSIGSISAGTVTVFFDGTTATAMGTFPLLDVVVPLQAGVSDLVMPNVINLPNLAGVDSAIQMVMLAADGATQTPIAVAGVQPDIALNAPTGTIVTIGGVVGATDVELNITPVPTTQVPMPLPDGLLGGSFVTIQPGNAAFDPPGAAMGLDVVLPNDLDFPIGTVVDIWSFDHDAGTWVNRSDQTGETGIVVDAGGGLTEVQASGVIVEGGWHAPVLTVDPSCGTTLTGRVVDNGSGLGIAGASIGLDTGQFGTSDSSGNFTIVSVPAYDVAALLADPMDCFPRDLEIEIVLPPSHGSGSSIVAVLAGSIVTGGTTDAGDYSFTVPMVGSVAGIVSGTPASPGEQVMLTPVGGGSTIMITPDSAGSFFMTGLNAGDYLSSFLFDGAASPVEETITIVANQVTSYSIQFAAGGGARDILVRVFMDDHNEFTPLTRASGAAILLQGTDSASSIGLVMTADSNGEATFMGVDGPFTVTASTDVLDQGNTLRIAASMIGIDPVDDVVSVLIFLESAPSVVALDATFSGTVTNMPTLAGTESMVVGVEATAYQGDSVFVGEFAVNPADGTFSGGIPSGYAYDAIVLHEDTQASSPIISSLILTGIAQTTPGGTIVQNFDYGSANVVPWDQPVSITFANVDAAITGAELSVDLDDLANGILFGLDEFIGVPAPLTFNLPDVTHAGLAGFKFTVYADAFDGTDAIYQDRGIVLSTTPAGLVFDFIQVPTPVSPSQGDSFTLAQLLALNVSFTAGGTGGFGNNGLNFAVFDTELGVGTPPAGIDGSCWEFFLPGGVSSFTMPKAPLPMIASGQGMFGGASQFRTLGTPVNFSTFFNGGFEANFAALFTDSTGEADVEIEYSFSVQ